MSKLLDHPLELRMSTFEGSHKSSHQPSKRPLILEALPTYPSLSSKPSIHPPSQLLRYTSEPMVPAFKGSHMPSWQPSKRPSASEAQTVQILASKPSSDQTS